MILRYGMIDTNVRKRSVEDVILREGQRFGNIPKPPDSRVLRAVAAEPAVSARSGAGRIGELAVLRAVNSLAAEGKRAELFSPVILLSPGTGEEELRGLFRQICRTAFPLGIGIRSGHVEVTDAVTRPVIFGTAQGRTFSREERDPGTSCAGMDIVAAGQIGMEGTCILVSEFRGILQKRFSEAFLERVEKIWNRLCAVDAAETAAGNGVHSMVSLSAGGFFAGLWELSQKTGCGLTADLQAVPILQETIEITEYFAVNPYAMRSTGCILLAARNGSALLGELQNASVDAAVIGTLNDTRKKILRNGEEIRYLDRPGTDALDAYLHHCGRSASGEYLI